MVEGIVWQRDAVTTKVRRRRTCFTIIAVGISAREQWGEGATKAMGISAREQITRRGFFTDSGNFHWGATGRASCTGTCCHFSDGNSGLQTHFAYISPGFGSMLIHSAVK